MIKAVVERHGMKPLVILGLSRRNVDLLTIGQPIHVHGDELGVNADIVIHFGETEDAMRGELFAALGRPGVDIDRRKSS